MVEFETVNELCEELADKLGIYGVPTSYNQNIVDHPENCECRICFVSELEDRMIEAVENDKFLAKRGE